MFQSKMFSNTFTLLVVTRKLAIEQLIQHSMDAFNCKVHHQVVSGLVQEQDVRRLQQHARDRDAPPLAAGKVRHQRVACGGYVRQSLETREATIWV